MILQAASWLVAELAILSDATISIYTAVHNEIPPLRSG